MSRTCGGGVDRGGQVHDIRINHPQHNRPLLLAFLDTLVLLPVTPKPTQFPHTSQKRQEAQLVSRAVIQPLRAAPTAHEISLQLHHRPCSIITPIRQTTETSHLGRQIFFQQPFRPRLYLAPPVPKRHVPESPRSRVRREVVDESVEIC